MCNNLQILILSWLYRPRCVMLVNPGYCTFFGWGVNLTCPNYCSTLTHNFSICELLIYIRIRNTKDECICIGQLFRY
jgi:hypothetical protein